MLRETDRAKGGNPKLTGNVRLPVEPTLEQIGLSKRESSEAQKLAALPAERFEALKAGKEKPEGVRSLEGPCLAMRGARDTFRLPTA